MLRRGAHRQEYKEGAGQLAQPRPQEDQEVADPPPQSRQSATIPNPEGHGWCILQKN